MNRTVHKFYYLATVQGGRLHYEQVWYTTVVEDAVRVRLGGGLKSSDRS